MPYGEDGDRQPFVMLKERGVTFFDDNHADFNARVQRYARALFGEVRTGGPASNQETIEAP
jgi:hypothetical protein